MSTNKKIQVNFWFDLKVTKIECSLNDKLIGISNSFSNKIGKDFNSLHFFYGGEKLNLNKTINQIINQNDLNLGGLHINVEEIIIQEKEIPIEKDVPKKAKINI